MAHSLTGQGSRKIHPRSSLIMGTLYHFHLLLMTVRSCE
jgi:hypothetical protein